jgi:hypothetical protein
MSWLTGSPCFLSATPSRQRACGALWIDRGLLQQDGPVAEVRAVYQRFTQFKRING